MHIRRQSFSPCIRKWGPIFRTLSSTFQPSVRFFNIYEPSNTRINLPYNIWKDTIECSTCMEKKMGVLNAALCSLFWPDVFSFPHLNATIKRANTRLSVRLISPLRHSFQISEKIFNETEWMFETSLPERRDQPFRLSNPQPKRWYAQTLDPDNWALFVWLLLFFTP